MIAIGVDGVRFVGNKVAVVAVDVQLRAQFLFEGIDEEGALSLEAAAHFSTAYDREEFCFLFRLFDVLPSRLEGMAVMSLEGSFFAVVPRDIGRRAVPLPAIK